jgi:DNA-binding PadR family transcriptional regulator
VRRVGDPQISSDLIRGHVDTIVLALLVTADRYGYEICKQIATLSSGEYELKEPTLYSAFRRLERQDLIRSYWGGESQGGRRKYYAITDDGTEVYRRNVEDWRRARRLIDTLIGSEGKGE